MGAKKPTSERPIEPGDLENALDHPGAGATVTFVGRIRDTNRGRAVARLKYEGAAGLAAAAFAEISAEARGRFEVSALRCVHRVGALEVGEIAVWIGVSAPHRGPAFDACRYLIDELKRRVPIWKKEFYQDGDSGWIHSP